MNLQETTAQRASLWDLAVAIYASGLGSSEEISKWNRHQSMMVTHELKDENLFEIGVTDSYSADYLKENYEEKLRLALIRVGASPDIRVVFKASEEAAKLNEGERQRNLSISAPVEAPVKKPAMLSTLPFNADYTFENFVTGPSNSFANAIARAVAKDPGGKTNNPFFIWGGAGLGKTHLMQAIGHRVMMTMPSKSVCYITAEAFLNEYVNAMANNTRSNNTMEQFRARYRHFDLLLLDDVQFIGAKMQIQQEFFNTYNSLMDNGGQVVMTCDLPPAKLNGFEERLITRFQQGITIEIESPSYETRLAILKSKVKGMVVNIPDFVLNYIGENIDSSVRAMEGALNLAASFIQSNPGFSVTPEIVRELLKNLIENETQIRRLSVDEIVKSVCAAYKINYADILGKERTQPLATARQVAMLLVRKLTGNSLPTIADYFKRNHTTVLHGVSSIVKRLDVEPELKQTIVDVTVQLGRKPAEVFE